MFGPFRQVIVTNYFTLEEAPSLSPNSADAYYRITGQDSVICCVLDSTDHLVMVKQYRPNLGDWTLEVPAGGVEKTEPPIAAARRELAEEVGLRCPMLPLGRAFRLMMNRTNINDHLFFAMFPEAIPDFTPEHGIEVVRVPRCDLLRLSVNGDYQQLAGLGLLQLTGGILGVDMWRSPLDAIAEAFQQQPGVYWNTDA